MAAIFPGKRGVSRTMAVGNGRHGGRRRRTPAAHGPDGTNPSDLR